MRCASVGYLRTHGIGSAGVLGREGGDCDDDGGEEERRRERKKKGGGVVVVVDYTILAR